MSSYLESSQQDSFSYEGKSDQDIEEKQVKSEMIMKESIKCEDEEFTPFISGETFHNGERLMVPQVKEEPCFYEGYLPHSTTMDLKPIKEEQTDMDIDCSGQRVHIQRQSVQVKDEPFTPEERSQQRTDMSTCTDLHRRIKEEPLDNEVSSPSGYEQCQSFAMKEESLSSDEDDSPPLSGTAHSFSISRDSKPTYACPVCKRTFDSHGNLSRHRETHKGVKMSCSLCKANFCNKTDLAAHAKEHKASRASHGSSKIMHACPVCKRTFHTHADLVRHRETHKGKTMSCKECGADFCNKTDLAAHSRIHRVSGAPHRPSNTIYTCPVCKRTFNSPGNLIKHSESQKGVRVSCLQCGANFCNKTDLAAHARKHRVGKVFPCSECDKIFPSLSHLMVHKTVHTGEKPLTCTQCGKHFTDESSLVEHVKVHAVIKEFCCTICGKAYAQHEDLLNHHLQTHEEEVTIICSECGLTFVDQDTLDRHLRFHKLHKPFSCGLCGKQFVHKTELIRHERTHINWTASMPKRLDQK